jgi:hypothetical protein
MRYVIRNVAGHYFSGCFVPETRFVPRPGNPTVADPVSLLEPRFESLMVRGAVKYDSAADADAMLTHVDLADPAAFKDCAVLEVEFDKDDLEAVR